MKRILLTMLACVGMLCAFPIIGLEPQEKVTIEPQTGDIEFDAVLGDLNIEASANLAGFLNHLSVSYNVPEEELEPLITEEDMEPADVYMAVVIADLTETPIEDIITEYQAGEGQGWGVIAKRLGIKPGSQEFHQLKQGLLSDVEGLKRTASPGGKSENPGKEKKKEKKEKKK